MSEPFTYRSVCSGILSWIDKAYAVTNGTDKNMGKYISGIKRYHEEEVKNG